MLGAQALPSSIFRAYDIRGIVGETLTEESVFLIGKALGSMVRERKQDRIIIARDGRFSGPMLSHVLTEGLLSTGCHVMDLGMVPTPALYYATHVLGYPAGVMLTGSHNPPEYNGLKIVLEGKALTEEEIQSLYQRILEKRFWTGTGTKQTDDIVERYCQAISENIHLERPLRVVIDAGNGVTGMLAPQLFKALGCEVIELFCQVDGYFPHHHPDPSVPENLTALIQGVRDQKADIGLAFDGDGDRLGVVTCRGEIIYPDRLLMLFAKSLLIQPNASDIKVIYDVKCTNQLAPLIRSLNGEPMMWKTGHSLIKAKLTETNAQLAGEMSGHFFFKDRWFGFDDGLYAGARLLEILAQQTQDSHAVFAEIPNSVNTSELKVLVTEEEKFNLMRELIAAAHFKDTHELMTIDGLRVNFQDGWGLVRPSNTSPYLILRFEAIDHTILEKIKQVFREWMLSVKPDLVLPF